jgi:hypothetical protein
MGGIRGCPARVLPVNLARTLQYIESCVHRAKAGWRAAYVT